MNCEDDISGGMDGNTYKLSCLYVVLLHVSICCGVDKWTFTAVHAPVNGKMFSMLIYAFHY